RERGLPGAWATAARTFMAGGSLQAGPRGGRPLADYPVRSQRSAGKSPARFGDAALRYPWDNSLSDMRTARIVRALVLVLPLVAAPPAHALDARQRPFATRTWQRADALQALAQGPDGMLWVGSQGGLARFDGERFTDVELVDGHHR